jgi:hypothetical protein
MEPIISLLLAKAMTLGQNLYEALFSRHAGEKNNVEELVPDANSILLTPNVYAETSDAGASCSSGGDNGGGCFSKGTFVATDFDAQGNIVGRPIEEIAAAERIIGSPVQEAAVFPQEGPTLGRAEIKKRHDIAAQTRIFVTITLEGGTRFSATTTHPFFVQEGDLIACKVAGELEPGMIVLVTKDHRLVPDRIRTITSRESTEPVFHLSTTTENFLVSEDGHTFVLVHNK